MPRQPLPTQPALPRHWAILAILNDLEKYSLLNPLVLRIEPHSHTLNQLLAHKQLPPFGLKMPITHRSAHHLVAGNIDAEAWSSPRVHIKNEWRDEQGKGAVVLREGSTLTTFSFLLGSVSKTAQASHEAMMKKFHQELRAAKI